MAKRILVIDDDEDILSLMDIIFEEEGYQVTLLKTGTTTDYIKVLRPHLILLDIRIVGFQKTGDEFCNLIRKERELDKVPVILVSAEPNLHMLANNCGANSYINKPFSIDYLLAKVKEFLS